MDSAHYFSRIDLEKKLHRHHPMSSMRVLRQSAIFTKGEAQICLRCRRTILQIRRGDGRAQFLFQSSFSSSSQSRKEEMPSEIEKQRSAVSKNISNRLD